MTDDQEISDRELPDESDQDPDADLDITDTEPCPYCKREIYSEAEFCHHCGKVVNRKRGPGPKIFWLFLLIAIVLICAMVYQSF